MMRGMTKSKELKRSGRANNKKLLALLGAGVAVAAATVAAISTIVDKTKTSDK